MELKSLNDVAHLPIHDIYHGWQISFATEGNEVFFISPAGYVFTNYGLSAYAKWENLKYKIAQVIGLTKTEKRLTFTNLAIAITLLLASDPMMEIIVNHDVLIVKTYLSDEALNFAPYCNIGG